MCAIELRLDFSENNGTGEQWNGWGLLYGRDVYPNKAIWLLSCPHFISGMHIFLASM